MSYMSYVLFVLFVGLSSTQELVFHQALDLPLAISAVFV